MWQQNVANVLSHMGWGSGFRLPVANKENLELERELERKQRLISQLQIDLEDEVKHNEILENGIKHATDLIAQENKLRTARHAALLAEKEIQRLSQRELERTQSELRTSHKSFMELKQRNKDLCNDLEDRKRHVNELVDLIEYDRKELIRLEKEAEEKDVYMQMLDELCEADADVLKKCEERYKAAGEALAMSRLEMDKEVALTLVAQNELEGLGERFRNLHKERGEIVDLWKHTLISLQSRDDDMCCIAEDFTSVQAALKAKDVELDAKKCSFEGFQRTTSQSDGQLNKWDRVVADLREAIKDVAELGQTFRDSIIGYETSIALTSEEIKALRKKTMEIEKELLQIQGKIIRAEATLADLQARADITKMEALSAAEKMKQISEMVEEEEKKLETLGRDLDKEMRRKSLWSAKKRHLQLQSVDLDHEIKGAFTKASQVTEDIKRCGLKLDMRKSTVYKVEIQLISAQHKLKMILNPQEFDANKFNRDQDTIVQLRRVLREVIHNKAFLTVQSGHIDDVNRRIYQEKITATKEVEHNQDQINEVRMSVQTLAKTLTALESDYLDTIVERSLIQLKVTQMKKTVMEQKNFLYNAEYHRVLLQSAAKEKRSEIEIHAKLLESKRKSIREEVSVLKIQVNHVIDNVEKKRKRYEIVMYLMATPSEEPTSDIRSEAYYVLQMAQEREMLKKEGDMWDRKVKEAEKETEALQNTLSLMTCSNDLFKDSLKPMPDEGYQSQMKELQQKQKDAMSKKNRAIRALNRIDDEIATKNKEIETIHHQLVHFRNKVMDKEYEHRVLQGDLRNQEMSVRRVRALTVKILQSLHFAGDQEREIVSIDIRFRATQRKLEFAFNALAKFLTVYPENTNEVGQFLCEHIGKDVTFRFLKRLQPLPECSPSSTKSFSAVPKKAKSVRTHAMLRTPSVSPSSSAKRLARHSAFDTRTESHQKILRSVASAVEKSIQNDKKRIKRNDEAHALKKMLVSSKSVKSSDSERSGIISLKRPPLPKSGASSAGGSRSSVVSIDGKNIQEKIPPPLTPTKEISAKGSRLEGLERRSPITQDSKMGKLSPTFSTATEESAK